MNYKNFLENLLDIKIDFEINTERELIDLINNPRKYISDENIIKKIESLKEVLEYFDGI